MKFLNYLQIAVTNRALKTELETTKLTLQTNIDSKAPKIDVQNLKVDVLEFQWYISVKYKWEQ